MSTPSRGPNQNAGFNLDNLTDQSGSLTPTLRVSAGAASFGQSLKQYSGSLSIVTGGTVVLQTTTTGKTFYVTDMMVYSNTAAVFAVTLNAAATPIFNAFCKGDTGPIQVCGLETQPSASSGVATSIVFGTAAGTTCSYNIFGYEQ